MRQRRGAALIALVLIAVVVLSGLMMASYYVREATDRAIENELNFHGQAVNAAKAGLVDGLAWFRRQTGQPVNTFAPERDLLADPVINESDDADIGLVREYQISTREHIWGRYEVRKRVVEDITAQRGLPGVGRYWYIEAKGYVFERLDEDYAPDEFYALYELSDGELKRKLGDGTYETVSVTPNEMLQERSDENVVKVLASVTMASEIRRLSIVPPADGAICANRADDVFLNNRSRVNGHDGYGVVYPNGTGSIHEHHGAELSGDPPHGGADPATYSLEEEDVFGVSPDELRALADIYTDDPSSLPDVLPDYGIVYIEGNVTWNSSRPLLGTAILYVDGNVTIAGNSSSYFSGIIYTTGHYHQNAPALVNGTIMCKDKVQINGSGDYSEVNFDGDIIDQLLTISGQYRFSMPMYFAETD